jgi:protein-serine/threonine kinase
MGEHSSVAMSTATAITPPTAASSFTKNSYETQPQPTLNQLPNLHIDDKSTSLSDISSPEPRTLDLRSPILEEEEDDISSEAANEPVTPTYNYHSHTLPDRMIGATKPGQDSVHTLATASASETPTILSTSPTPSLLRRPTTKPEATKQVPKTPTPKRPGLSSKDSHIKRGLSGFFRRSNSHGASDHHVIPFHMVDGANESDPTLRQKQPKATRRMSANNSPYTTQSNTPPSPRSPVLDGADDRPTQPQLSVQEPSKDELNTSRRKTRSSTGFGIRGKLHLHKPKTPLHSEARAPTNPQTRHRATSVDLENVVPDHSITGTRSPDAKLPERSIWALPAETGIGLKSRRLSLSLPDDFFVDVAELYTEFQDQSKLVGKRGKSIGKGATSKVKLMTRKGYPNEVYAVKEFRGKSSTEKHEEYEKKVKSEFSIAKSVHHPNIVETIRLCTYDGRWNHVMEYCDQGDLFTLVSQKYLSRPDRLNDRLCFFKQMAQGIHYLHSNGIAHRDIKLENLLVTRDSKLKITDFGVSEVFAGTHPGLRSAGGECGKDMGEIRLCAPGMCGSPPYVAPEVLEKNGNYFP